MAEYDVTGSIFGSLWNEIKDTVSNTGEALLDAYVKIETSKQETSNAQIPASVGVTEPVTQPVQTVTDTPTTVMTSPAQQQTNQLIAGVDNKYLALGVGGLVLAVMVLGGRR
ncbi:hypothetical protein [Marinomonas fungiae]|uniref:hypothetical protein n=1 Tax=Marinomonas fungiae TaxID=1137284 RepID=UPI003A929390